MKSQKLHQETYYIWLGALIFFLWQAAHLGGLRWDYDEGTYLATTRLIHQGCALYTEVAATHPPLFFYTLTGAFALPGNPIILGRLVILLFSMVGLLATAFMAQNLGGKWAGLLALILLAFHPTFWVYSRVITGNIPSLSMAMLSLWLLLQYQVRRHKGWLLASGTAMGLGLSIKFLPMYLLPLAPLLIFFIYHPQLTLNFKIDWKNLLLDIILWGMSSLFIFLLLLIPFDHTAVWQSIVAIRFKSQSFQLEQPNWLLVTANLFITFGGYSFLALTGIFYLWGKNRWQGVWMLSWIILNLLVLLNYSPLWPHFFVTLTFPFAILSGISLKFVWQHIQKLRQKQKDFSLLNALAIAGLLWLILITPKNMKTNLQFIIAPTPPGYLEVLDFLKQNANPNRYIITDEQLFFTLTDVRLPSELADTSNLRIVTKPITTAELITLTEKYHPQFIIFGADRRFQHNLPDYVNWVSKRYTPASVDAPGTLIFADTTNDTQR